MLLFLAGGLGGEAHGFLLTESFDKFSSMMFMSFAIAKGLTIKESFCVGLLGGLSLGSVTKYVGTKFGFRDMLFGMGVVLKLYMGLVCLKFTFMVYEPVLLVDPAGSMNEDEATWDTSS